MQERESKEFELDKYNEQNIKVPGKHVFYNTVVNLGEQFWPSPSTPSRFTSAEIDEAKQKLETFANLNEWTKNIAEFEKQGLLQGYQIKANNFGKHFFCFNLNLNASPAKHKA